MKKHINKLAALALVAIAIACVDESKDPIKFDSVKKATYLAIRGDANDALVATGCSNSFFKNNILGTEAFSFDSDLLAEDQESLQEVQLYAQTPKIARVQVATFPGSDWKFPSDSKIKRGKVSVPLATILSKLGLTSATTPALKQQDITMSVDLVLTDGTKVLASSIVATGLFASVIFQPAMVLTYCAEDTKDFLPVASPRLLGEWSVKDKKVVHTVLPIKTGAKDTLYIKYDQAVITPPTVVFDPATAGTATALVKAKKVDANGFYTKDDDPSAFYLVYTANGSYSGEVEAKITGATANVAGAILTQAAKTIGINVDNTSPQRISTSTGGVIGKGQFVTIKVSFNEKLSTKSANAIKVKIDGTARGLETVTDAVMTVASNGLSASLTYIFKLKDPTVDANHGPLTIDFTTDAKDEAGNSTSIPDATLVVDVGTPPAPSLTLAGGHDLGVQIKWSASQSDGAGNLNGSTSGKVYFIALAAGDPAPTKFSVDLDGVATWLGTEDDPDSQTTPKAKKPIDGEEQGIVEVEDGGSGTVFTPFAANGTFDIYAVFVSSSGTISAITAAPQLAGVVMN